MRARVKAAIGVGVVLAAFGAFFSVHAMTGGADLPSATFEASQTPALADSQALVVSAVCAPGHPDCVDVTVVPDNELTCEEAAVCAPTSTPGALPLKCDPK